MREDLKYLIVGDTIIDEDISLEAVGLSLESPTLKTTYRNKNINYGGAANVARFLAGFDRDVTFLTSLSDDHIGMMNLKVKSFYQGKNNTKSRYWVTHGDSTYKYLQINDVNDEDSISPLIDIDLSPYDIIALADYRCGFITDPFIKTCLSAGKMTYVSSQVSSRPSNYYKYEDFDYIVCNEKESRLIKRDNDVCITKGSKGCSFNGVDFIPYPVENPVNTIGAGDCFYAALLATGDPDYANRQASKFVASEIHEQNN